MSHCSIATFRSSLLTINYVGLIIYIVKSQVTKSQQGGACGLLAQMLRCNLRMLVIFRHGHKGACVMEAGLSIQTVHVVSNRPGQNVGLVNWAQCRAQRWRHVYGSCAMRAWSTYERRRISILKCCDLACKILSFCDAPKCIYKPILQFFLKNVST